MTSAEMLEQDKNAAGLMIAYGMMAMARYYVALGKAHDEAYDLAAKTVRKHAQGIADILKEAHR